MRIVLVPGIFGCSMTDAQGREIWPPGDTTEPISTPELVTLLSSPATTVGTVIRDAVCSGFYGPLMDRMQAIDPHYVAFAYDWRADIRAAAATLSETLGGMDGGRMVIVSHSMGGLVTRYMLESGAYANEPWFERVAAAVFVATPHLGAPLALFRLLGKSAFNNLVLPAWSMRALNADPKQFPSGFQLLPPAGVDCATQVGAIHQDVPTAFAGQLDPVGLAAMAALHDVLDRFQRPAGIAYHLAYGIGTAQTVSGAMLDAHGGFAEGSGDGDGTVPAWSGKPFLKAAEAAFPDTAAFMADHVGILANAGFLAQLEKWIGAAR